MKILLIAQARKAEDQVGYERAWRSLADVRTIPWIGLAETRGWSALWDEILCVNREWKPELVFFQRFHSGQPESPADCVAALRLAANRPIVFGDIGDLYQPYWGHPWVRRFPRAIVDLARAADCFFVTALGRQAQWLQAHGARRIELLPLAFSNEHFPDWNAPLPNEYRHDVVMVGSICLQLSRPISTLEHIRRRMVAANALWKRFGERFALYGRGWRGHPACRGDVPYREQVRLYQSARVCVDAPPPCDEECYCSNRPFYIAGAGATLVQQYQKGLENIFRAGRDAYFVRDAKELVRMCDELLSRDPRELRRLGEDTRRYIQEHHTVACRVQRILEIAKGMRG